MTIEAQRHRFTVDDYHRLGELGFFDPEIRTELLEGEIIDMATVREPHAECVDLLAARFIRALDPTVRVRVQNPVRLSRLSEPLPDLVLARARPGGFVRSHPEPDEILLLIEVADTSYAKDRELKLPLYATAGIPEVWIVNLLERRIEVYRRPAGSQYTEMQFVGEGETVTPAALPTVVVAVDAVMPGRE
jgi:Uma2 family endonuclease